MAKANSRDQAARAGGLASWINDLVQSHRVTRKGVTVLDVIVSQPRVTSYAPAQEVAKLADVNEATVTRAAQALGFSGWPAFQQELRARYLSSLNAVQVAAEHHGVQDHFRSSLNRDAASLSSLLRLVDAASVDAVVAALVAARRIRVVASGSYASVGLALSHHLTVAGYPASLLSVPEGTANEVARMGPGDVMVVISLWAQYRDSVIAARYARERGATIGVITDSAHSELAGYAHHVILVPTEGVSFMPSLTASIAVAHGLVAEVAAFDAEHTRRSVAEAEKAWTAFGLTNRRGLGSGGAATP